MKVPNEKSGSDDATGGASLSTWQIVAIALVTLTAVVAGTLFTLRFEGPRPRNRPTALGHYPPERSSGETTATNAPPKSTPDRP